MSRIDVSDRQGAQMIDNTDEKDIELMFAEARRYDLLTAEQEQSIDSIKWSAVREIYALIAQNDELSQYLAQFCCECLENPHRFSAFRIETCTLFYAASWPPCSVMGRTPISHETSPESYQSLKRGAARLKHVESLKLPASLTIGIAVAILRRAGGQFADTVADAIGHWQRHWQTPVPSFALDHTLPSAIKKQLRTYTGLETAWSCTIFVSSIPLRLATKAGVWVTSILFKKARLD